VGSALHLDRSYSSGMDYVYYIYQSWMGGNNWNDSSFTHYFTKIFQHTFELQTTKNKGFIKKQVTKE